MASTGGAGADAGPGVGFEYPRFEVSWTERDLLLFAASIGVTNDELWFLYVSITPYPQLSMIRSIKRDQN